MHPNDLVLQSNVRSMEGIEDTQDFQDLLISIEQIGVRSPVEYWVENGKNIVKDGFRRVMASRYLQLEDIPAVRIKRPTEEELIRDQLISGIQRSNLCAIDIAKGMAALKNQFGATNEAIAAQFGKSPSWVSQHLRLLNLIPEIQVHVETMGYRTAYEASILSLEDQGKFLSSIIATKTTREMKRLKRSIAYANSIEREDPVVVQTVDAGDEEIEIETESQPDENYTRCLRLIEMAVSNIRAAKRTAEESQLNIADMLQPIVVEVLNA